MRLIERVFDFLLGPPVESLNVTDEDRLAVIRHKAESAEAAEAARRFLREPVMKQVMPHLDGVEL